LNIAPSPSPAQFGCLGLVWLGLLGFGCGGKVDWRCYRFVFWVVGAKMVRKISSSETVIWYHLQDYPEFTQKLLWKLYCRAKKKNCKMTIKDCSEYIDALKAGKKAHVLSVTMDRCIDAFKKKNKLK
jgi:uncharacterized protein Usg